jgi:hypothetical protein
MILLATVHGINFFSNAVASPNSAERIYFPLSVQASSPPQPDPDLLYFWTTLVMTTPALAAQLADNHTSSLSSRAQSSHSGPQGVHWATVTTLTADLIGPGVSAK